MHEMAYMRSIVDTVVSQAHEQGAAEIVEVRLVIGEARDFIDEFCSSLFAFLARGTVAEGARLEIRRTPTTVRCNRCGEVFGIDVFDEGTWICPACAAKRDYRPHTGWELSIDSIVARGHVERAAG